MDTADPTTPRKAFEHLALDGTDDQCRTRPDRRQQQPWTDQAGDPDDPSTGSATWVQP